MKITVIGTGYVGLVTGACLADVGNDVMCLDIDEAKIAQLERGKIPIHEPGLDEIVLRNHQSGRLMFSSSYDAGVEHGDLLFIAVGTPTDTDGSADLRYVTDAARQLGKRITRDVVVIVKSTVPVGTTERVGEIVKAEVAARGVKVQLGFASNPEFLKEGYAVRDFMQPDRILVGTSEPHTAEVLRSLYAPFNRNHQRLMLLDARSSEFSKYAANAMLATRISFMNELSGLADRLGADIESVRQAIGADPRIGPSFLYAGMGFGGSCFPKDIRAMLSMAREQHMPASVLNAVEDVNERQKRVLFDEMVARLGSKLRGSTIAVWGLAFKPNTDDMREAPSLVLIEALIGAGARVRGYDPVSTDNARKLLAKYGAAVEFCASAREACQGADVLAVVTEWLEFRSPDFDWLCQTLTHQMLFDGRNLYDPQTVQAAGLTYIGIGRGHERSA